MGNPLLTIFVNASVETSVHEISEGDRALWFDFDSASLSVHVKPQDRASFARSLRRAAEQIEQAVVEVAL